MAEFALALEDGCSVCGGGTCGRCAGLWRCDAFLDVVRVTGEAGYFGAVREGESGDMCLEIVKGREDYTFRRNGALIELTFTDVKVAAFIHGVVRGELDQDTVPTEVVVV
ncbi:hypothetical protein OOZ19_04355 [Saccharopolyspora sp. NFXS83]|uniref:hypothetical protein n=1 Tax=Saccharopolyspora sp. NFXS83 TaxID=2993560 RepID=UPI00224AC805|nr:hypothetical protein [Saccharopolyspora sp. NFXS83]MCX2729460.1 hypothetical protein [Saccharopolyspora sp. NFXS83]